MLSFLIGIAWSLLLLAYAFDFRLRHRTPELCTLSGASFIPFPGVQAVPTREGGGFEFQRFTVEFRYLLQQLISGIHPWLAEQFGVSGEPPNFESLGGRRGEAEEEEPLSESEEEEEEEEEEEDEEENTAASSSQQDGRTDTSADGGRNGGNKYRSALEKAKEFALREAFAGEADGWSLVTNKRDVDVWKKPLPGEAVPCIRGTGIVEAPLDLVFLVMNGTTYVHRTDKGIEKTIHLEKTDPRSTVDRVCYHPVWPTKARDFVLTESWEDLPDLQPTPLARQAGLTEVHPEIPSRICIWSSVEHPKAPPQSSHVRATCHASCYIIQPFPDGERCFVTYVCRVDLGGKLPGWLVKSIANDQALSLANMRDVIMEELPSWRAKNPPKPPQQGTKDVEGEETQQMIKSEQKEESRGDGNASVMGEVEKQLQAEQDSLVEHSGRIAILLMDIASGLVRDWDTEPRSEEDGIKIFFFQEPRNSAPASHPPVVRLMLQTPVRVGLERFVGCARQLELRYKYDPGLESMSLITELDPERKQSSRSARADRLQVLYLKYRSRSLEAARDFCVLSVHQPTVTPLGSKGYVVGWQSVKFSQCQPALDRPQERGVMEASGWVVEELQTKDAPPACLVSLIIQIDMDAPTAARDAVRKELLQQNITALGWMKNYAENPKRYRP